MPSLQLFIQDASSAAAWAANTPLDDFWGMLLVLWFYIASLFAGAIDYIATEIHQLSEWIQQPGALLPDICPIVPYRTHDSTNDLEIQILCLVWFIVFWVVLFIPLLMGFGPAGVLAGELLAQASTMANWLTVRKRFDGSRFPIMDVWRIHSRGRSLCRANVYRHDRSFPTCTSRLGLSHSISSDRGCRWCTRRYYRSLNPRSRVMVSLLRVQQSKFGTGSL
jgi:hypothetical protein